MIKEICRCVRGFEDLKGSAVECTDQNGGFCKDLNKTQFRGCNPYNGDEPHYITCCGFCCVVVLFFMH